MYNTCNLWNGLQMAQCFLAGKDHKGAMWELEDIYSGKPEFINRKAVKNWGVMKDGLELVSYIMNKRGQQ